MSIIFEHVDYWYDTGRKEQVKVLDDICLKIEDGEFVGIIGHTGSGKSTLIQHMNGLLKPTAGTIYYNGEDITRKKYKGNELRKKVGLVFQYPEYQLFESTVIEDVKYGPRNMGLDSLEVDCRAYEALKMVGIGEELLDASPFELSGGQKRRVAIAGVLAMKPEVLIMDEPTAGLDPGGRERFFELIQKLHREQKITVILVSHSMEDMGRFAERLIVMNQGKIFAKGTPKEVYHYYRELETIGLSAPDVTYIMKELKKSGVKVNDDAVTVDDAVQSLLRLRRS